LKASQFHRFYFLVFIISIPTPANLLFARDESVAVLDFDPKGISETEASVLADRLEAELVRIRRVTVVERGKMGQVLEEQDFQLSGCTSNECAVEIGQILGVTQMVAGSVGKIGSTYSINIRVVDVASGAIIRSVIRDFKGEIDGLLQQMFSIADELTSGDSTTGPISTIVQNNQQDKASSITQRLPQDGLDIGDHVITYRQYGERGFLLQGEITGLNRTLDLVQVKLLSGNIVTHPRNDVIEIGLGEVSIGAGFGEGDSVLVYREGFHTAQVSSVGSTFIEVSYVGFEDGFEKVITSQIKRSYIVYFPD
jgi:TolB-like protein